MTKLFLSTLKHVLTFCLFLTFEAANAQTFYEVNFTDPEDGEDYIGLIIYYNDENCKMRLVSDELLSQDKVLESAYTSVVGERESADDVGVMVYAPEKEEFPNFVWIWEEDDASDINEAPFVTYDLDDPDTYAETRYFREITLADMNEKYVSQFYGESEKEYKMLMQGINRVMQQNNASPDGAPLQYGNSNANPSTSIGSAFNGVLTQDSPQEVPDPLNNNQNPTQATLSDAERDWGDGKPSMYAIVLANTNVSDIGVACRKDAQNVYSELEGIARVLDMHLYSAVLADNDFSKANLYSIINQTNPGKNDVIVFVYTGHGFRFDDQTDYFPNMDIAPTSYDNPLENYVPASEVYKALTSKGARLNIVLTDCCNSKIGTTTPIINNNTLFSRSNTNFDIEKLRKLFLESKGNLIATASSPGEYSWCGVNGGYFILSVLESLRNQISVLNTAQPSWDALINDAISSAARKTESNQNCKRQNGIKSINIK